MTAFQEQPRLIAPNIRRDILNAALMDAAVIGGKCSAEFLADSGVHLKLEGLREASRPDTFILTVTEQSGVVQRWAWGGTREAKLIDVRSNGRGEKLDRALELKGDGLIRQLTRENRLGKRP